VVTQQEKDSLLAAIAARKVVDFTGITSLLFTFHHRVCFITFIAITVVPKLIKCPICNKGIKEPKTLPCLHSFCQKCLEKNEFDLREKPQCEVCKAPYDGAKNLTAGVFIDSLSRSLTNTVKNANKVKCEGCDEENATMHCADCGQNMGPVCVASHRRLRVSTSHQLIPLHDALKGKVEVKRVPHCQKHVGMEISTYCKTCNGAVCALCITEEHSGHTFCPLSQMTGPLQDQIADYTVIMGKREEEVKKAITNLDGAINKIAEYRSSAEKEISTLFASIRAATDVQHAQVLQEMEDKEDQFRKIVIKEKEDAESAKVEFREFRNFTEGLLGQETPLEIAGTHKIVGV